jgi:hypothetical protein
VFLPTADIYETNDALNVVLEMPGVDKAGVDIRVEDDLLKVEGRLDFSKYKGLQPLYTEYNVGHYSRSFRLSSKIRQTKQEEATAVRRFEDPQNARAGRLTPRIAPEMPIPLAIAARGARTQAT